MIGSENSYHHTNFSYGPRELDFLPYGNESEGPMMYNSHCLNESGPSHLCQKYPSKFALPLHGYLSPILVFFTIINNTLVCIVLLRKNMRTPTNSLLVAMAISDMFTGIFPVPVFLHFYAGGYYQDYIPYEWCYVLDYLTLHIPTIFHTASIWLTMALAIQRYIYICHSFQAKSWCTIRNVIKGTAAIYIASALSQTTRFFDSEYRAEPVQSLMNPNVTYMGCVRVLQPWITQNITLYYNFYYWFRVLFIHMIPCTSLVVLNALLINAMKKAQRRRHQLLKQNRKTECKKIKDSNCTTLMLVAVVGLFLLVEFPLGITMVVYIIKNTFNLNIIEPKVVTTLILCLNFFILLSYPLNFFIYCGMSRQFRESFKRLFVKGPMPIDRECSQYQTLATENGRTIISSAETHL